MSNFFTLFFTDTPIPVTIMIISNAVHVYQSPVSPVCGEVSLFTVDTAFSLEFFDWSLTVATAVVPDSSFSDELSGAGASFSGTNGVFGVGTTGDGSGGAI